MEIKPVGYRKPLQWGEQDPHRRASTPLGMWAWLAQRVSALALVVLIVFHLLFPYKPIVQLLLLLTVAFHAALGLRVILLDFNLVGIKYHRMLVWGLTALGLFIAFHVWRSIY